MASETFIQPSARLAALADGPLATRPTIYTVGRPSSRLLLADVADIVDPLAWSNDAHESLAEFLL